MTETSAVHWRCWRRESAQWSIFIQIVSSYVCRIQGWYYQSAPFFSSMGVRMPGYETRNSLDSCSDEGDSAPFAQLFCFILSSAFKTSHLCPFILFQINTTFSLFFATWFVFVALAVSLKTVWHLLPIVMLFHWSLTRGAKEKISYSPHNVIDEKSLSMPCSRLRSLLATSPSLLSHQRDRAYPHRCWIRRLMLILV